MPDMMDNLNLLADAEHMPHPTTVRVTAERAIAEITMLRGALRYIAVQAKASHPGALAVIQANAEAALRNADDLRQAVAALKARSAQ